MPEWTCGRCTFINHELMTNCEMCDAPKEAAQIPYLGEDGQPQRTSDSSMQSRDTPTDDIPMDHQTTQEPPADVNIQMDQQTTRGPSADDMLSLQSEMAVTNDSHLQPENIQQPDISPVNSVTQASLEVNVSSISTSPQQSPSAEAVNGTPECPKLPEPLAPVVLHSIDTQEPLESPMSEPEQVEEAMCIPSPDRAMADEENGWSFLENEVRLVMVGKTGVGKSTTGNNILGNKIFKSSASGASVTKKCQLGWASRFNRDIQIIDTPGLFDTGMSNEDISREIVKCIGMTSPGPHAFVLVIRLDRFTAEEKATVDHFINIFGKDMLKYLIVLFTRMDDLQYDGTTLDEYVQNVPPDLQNLLQMCQHRRIGFNNRGTQEERNKDVQELLQMVDSMVKGNGGGHYTNEMFEEAERIIAEQEEDHMRKNREEMKKEMERLRQEVEEELRKKEEEKLKDMEKMKNKLSELGIDEEDEEWVQVFSMSHVEEKDEPMKSLEASLSHRKDADETASRHTTSTSSVMVNGDVSPVPERQDIPETSTSSLEGSKRDTTERKAADDYFKASDVMSEPSENVGSLTQRQQTGSLFQTDDSCNPQSVNSNISFVSNEPAQSVNTNRSVLANEPEIQHSNVSEHDMKVQRLRERAMRMNEEHQRDRERMRADYTAKQAEALGRYNRIHMESRQRTRQEMNNVNSGIFSRMFGALKRFAKSITTPIGRGLQSLFGSVQGRTTDANRQSIF